ncbi:MAG: helix-turn-helix domain-containing protein [Alphaproteobacteria bacterium]|nr:helix-turn-helix domain-containing protein [Alphaproteobacteria bacterium]
MHKKAIYNLAIGLVLKELHEESRIDRSELAKALDTSDFDISKIENGSLRMTAGELVLMMELFELDWAGFCERVKKNLPRAEAAML